MTIIANYITIIPTKRDFKKWGVNINIYRILCTRTFGGELTHKHIKIAFIFAYTKHSDWAKLRSLRDKFEFSCSIILFL